MTTVDESQISSALKSFLASEEESYEEDQLTADLSLGDLDLTSSKVSIRGLEEQIQQFADSRILKAILDQGCDPREYERQYEGQLREAEQDSVQDYISESENLTLLYQEINTCDEILNGMEELLGKFQGDLGNISTEIRSLQEQSQSMSMKLRNRKTAESKLCTFLENIVIPASLIEGIVHGEVNESFQPQIVQELLAVLHKKLEFTNHNEAARSTAAYSDVVPELGKLQIKALSKIREFLLTRIYALRKPKTNIQILQQNVLLKHKFLMTFLREHGRDVYPEIRSGYVETLSRVLSSHFRAYLGAVEKLQEDTGKATDLIGDASQSALGGVMAKVFSRGGAAGGQRRSAAQIFDVGDRAAILHHLDQAAIIPHVAETEHKKYPFEALFRSINKLLMDTSTSEYLFCMEFFQDSGVYPDVIGPTLGVVEASLQAQLEDLHDLVGLLLLIRINGAHQLIMNRRRVPGLDGYLDRVNLMLWPRFKAVLDAQLGSLRALNPVPGPEVAKLHPMMERFATLAASLLLLNSDLQDNQVEHDLDRLRYTAQELLAKLARTFKHRKSRVIFLINNYAHVVQVFHEAAGKAARITPVPGATPPPQTAPLGMSGAETLRSFEDQLASSTNIYVEDALQQHFGALISFVKQADSAAGGASDTPPPGFGPAEAGPIAKDFTAKWSAAIETMNRDVTRDFQNGASGREVLKAAMTQLLTAYTKFLEIAKRGGPEGSALVRDSATVPSIMYEIKRYNRA